MTSMGDRWTDDMVDELFNCAPISSGQFDYLDFVRTIKHGARKDNDDDQPVSTPAAGTGSSRATPGGAAAVGEHGVYAM